MQLKKIWFSTIFNTELSLKITSDNDLHSSKAFCPIEHIEEEIIIFPNNEHSLKARGPIEVTEDGNDICFNDEHLPKVPIPIEVNDEGFSKVICSNDQQL